MFTLFYFPRNASWAPHMVLKHLNVPYELVLIDRKTEQQKASEYLALNPTGRIPTLVDKELVLFESAAICLHLCESHPENSLIPAPQSTQRAKFYQWLFYLTTTLQPEMMLYFYPQKHLQNEQGQIEISATQQQRVGEMFSLIDEQLSNSTYLLGEQLTVCDFYLFMLAHWASGFAKAPIQYQHLGRFMRVMAQQKTVVEVCEIEGTDLQMYR
ncbi:glutathione S-transferase family protein (plasmid) [Pseudoalteromonas sp. T1lg65]|uniref:glutathione S-transferase family protein n=1 Tax=Pseudoalteromonas sp. T1lg65 TaxID=2077101 RepID=UPI003F79F5F1